MKFVTYATHSERYFPALIESYEKFNADYVVLGFGDQWKDYFQKMSAIVEYLKESCMPDEVICVMDGFDSILVRSPDEMENRFLSSGEKVIFSKTEVLELFYSLHWNNTSFLNAGLYIGYARAIVFIIETILNKYTGGYFNDQRMFGNWIVKNKNKGFRVDKNNEFFLNVASHKPILSVLKEKKPFAVGGPGYGNLQPCIDHIGISFQASDYKNGTHTGWNRLMEGEFSVECQCVIPIALSLILLIIAFVVPVLAVYYS